MQMEIEEEKIILQLVQLQLLSLPIFKKVFQFHV